MLEVFPQQVLATILPIRPSKINNMLLVRTFWKSWWGRSLLFVILEIFVIFFKMATMSKMAAISYLKMVLWFYEYVLYVLKFCVCFCVHFDTLLFFPKSYSCFCSKASRPGATNCGMQTWGAKRFKVTSFSLCLVIAFFVGLQCTCKKDYEIA